MMMYTEKSFILNTALFHKKRDFNI